MKEEESRLWSMVSLARRAGKLAMGYDVVCSSISHGRAKLVLLAGDISEKSRRGVAHLCEEAHVPMRNLQTKMDEIWFTLGKRVGILAVEEPNFAARLTAMADVLAGQEAEGAAVSLGCGLERTGGKWQYDAKIQST